MTTLQVPSDFNAFHYIACIFQVSTMSSKEDGAIAEKEIIERLLGEWLDENSDAKQIIEYTRPTMEGLKDSSPRMVTAFIKISAKAIVENGAFNEKNLKSIIMDLIDIGKVNGDFSDNKLQFVNFVADLFGLPKNTSEEDTRGGEMPTQRIPGRDPALLNAIVGIYLELASTSFNGYESVTNVIMAILMAWCEENDLEDPSSCGHLDFNAGAEAFNDAKSGGAVNYREHCIEVIMGACSKDQRLEIIQRAFDVASQLVYDDERHKEMIIDVAAAFEVVCPFLTIEIVMELLDTNEVSYEYDSGSVSLFYTNNKYVDVDGDNEFEVKIEVDREFHDRGPGFGQGILSFRVPFAFSTDVDYPDAVRSVAMAAMQEHENEKFGNWLDDGDLELQHYLQVSYGELEIESIWRNINMISNCLGNLSEAMQSAADHGAPPTKILDRIQENHRAALTAEPEDGTCQLLQWLRRAGYPGAVLDGSLIRLQLQADSLPDESNNSRGTRGLICECQVFRGDMLYINLPNVGYVDQDSLDQALTSLLADQYYPEHSRYVLDQNTGAISISIFTICDLEKLKKSVFLKLLDRVKQAASRLVAGKIPNLQLGNDAECMTNSELTEATACNVDNSTDNLCYMPDPTDNNRVVEFRKPKIFRTRVKAPDFGDSFFIPSRSEPLSTAIISAYLTLGRFCAAGNFSADTVLATLKSWHNKSGSLNVVPEAISDFNTAATVYNEFLESQSPDFLTNCFNTIREECDHSQHLEVIRRAADVVISNGRFSNEEIEELNGFASALDVHPPIITTGNLVAVMSSTEREIEFDEDLNGVMVTGLSNIYRNRDGIGEFKLQISVDQGLGHALGQGFVVFRVADAFSKENGQLGNPADECMFVQCQNDSIKLNWDSETSSIACLLYLKIHYGNVSIESLNETIALMAESLDNAYLLFNKDGDGQSTGRDVGSRISKSPKDAEAMAKKLSQIIESEKLGRVRATRENIEWVFPTNDYNNPVSNSPGKRELRVSLVFMDDNYILVDVPGLLHLAIDDLTKINETILTAQKNAGVFKFSVNGETGEIGVSAMLAGYAEMPDGSFWTLLCSLFETTLDQIFYPELKISGLAPDPATHKLFDFLEDIPFNMDPLSLGIDGEHGVCPEELEPYIYGDYFIGLASLGADPFEVYFASFFERCTYYRFKWDGVTLASSSVDHYDIFVEDDDEDGCEVDPDKVWAEALTDGYVPDEIEEALKDDDEIENLYTAGGDDGIKSPEDRPHAATSLGDDSKDSGMSGSDEDEPILALSWDPAYLTPNTNPPYPGAYYFVTPPLESKMIRIKTFPAVESAEDLFPSYSPDEVEMIVDAIRSTNTLPQLKFVRALLKGAFAWHGKNGSAEDTDTWKDLSEIHDAIWFMPFAVFEDSSGMIIQRYGGALWLCETGIYMNYQKPNVFSILRWSEAIDDFIVHEDMVEDESIEGCTTLVADGEDEDDLRFTEFHGAERGPLLKIMEACWDVLKATVIDPSRDTGKWSYTQAKFMSFDCWGDVAAWAGSVVARGAQDASGAENARSAYLNRWKQIPAASAIVELVALVPNFIGVINGLQLPLGANEISGISDRIRQNRVIPFLAFAPDELLCQTDKVLFWIVPGAAFAGRFFSWIAVSKNGIYAANPENADEGIMICSWDATGESIFEDAGSGQFNLHLSSEEGRLTLTEFCGEGQGSQLEVIKAIHDVYSPVIEASRGLNMWRHGAGDERYVGFDSPADLLDSSLWQPEAGSESQEPVADENGDEGYNGIPEPLENRVQAICYLFVIIGLADGELSEPEQQNIMSTLVFWSQDNRIELSPSDLMTAVEVYNDLETSEARLALRDRVIEWLGEVESQKWRQEILARMDDLIKADGFVDIREIEAVSGIAHAWNCEYNLPQLGPTDDVEAIGPEDEDEDGFEDDDVVVPGEAEREDTECAREDLFVAADAPKRFVDLANVLHSEGGKRRRKVRSVFRWFGFKRRGVRAITDVSKQFALARLEVMPAWEDGAMDDFVEVTLSEGISPGCFQVLRTVQDDTNGPDDQVHVSPNAPDTILVPWTIGNGFIETVARVHRDGEVIVCSVREILSWLGVSRRGLRVAERITGAFKISHIDITPSFDQAPIDGHVTIRLEEDCRPGDFKVMRPD